MTFCIFPNYNNTIVLSDKVFYHDDAMQTAVMPQHVIHLSVCLSVCDVEVSYHVRFFMV